MRDAWSLIDKEEESEKILVCQYGIPITVGSFSTIHGQPSKGSNAGWLNDEVINYFMAYLEEACSTKGRQLLVFDSFFWTRLEKCLEEGKDISSLRKSKGSLEQSSLLLLPINRGNCHWSLGAVDVKKKGIMYFDPMLNSDKNRLEFSEKIRLFLGRRLDDQTIQDRSTWKDRVLYQAVQKDAKSCGVFVLKMAECLATGQKPTFSQTP